MPVISIFFGIIIKIHYRDHNPPHFHAEYQGYHGFFAISSGKLIAGDFPIKLQKILKEWTIQNKKDLLKNWELAQSRYPLFRIPGADQ